MKQASLLILLLFISLNGITEASSEELLLVIGNEQLPVVREALRDEYRLYAFLDEVSLLGVEGSGIASLEARGVMYTVAATDMRPGRHYLATSPPHAELNLADLGESVLYREGNVALVQADRGNALTLRRMGYDLVPLMPLARMDRPAVREQFLLLGKRRGDSFVERLIARVSPESLDSYVRALDGFQTRYSYTDSCRSASQWIYDRFQSFGVDVTFHEYDWGAEHWRNVVGTIAGKSDSTMIVVICGHFDSISEDPWNLAPGAEDNASGTALVLEAARVLSQEEHDYTLRFIAFSGEEQGLVGSHAYVVDAFGRGDNIIAAMNFDMVGYTDDERYDISVRYDSNSVWLGNLITAASRFTHAEPFSFMYTSPNSDHWYFQQHGYPATFSIHISRTHGYPFYHSVNDTAGNLNYQYLAEVTRMAVASMVMVGNGYPMPPLPPDYVEARDAGTGGAIQVGWNPSVTPGVLGYNVYYGRTRRVYDNMAYAGDTTGLLIGGLENGQRYFVSVAAIDDNAEGGYSAERSAVPREVPAPPESLDLMPIYLGLDLFWKRNSELDLAGYNVYRSTTSGGPYELVNAALLPDTTYSDSGLASGLIYYYVVTAVDTMDLESGYSEEGSSLPLSFDHGILLVDETRNGSGGTLLPDSVQDQFYGQLLKGYDYTSWDVDSAGQPTISAMGLYSTIVWRSEDIYEHHIALGLEDLSYYLAHGGNLWLIGWKAIGGLVPTGDYPYTFVPGDWPHDYLHLSASDNAGTTGLISAQGENGYPDVVVDSSKAPPGWGGSLYLIDTAVPFDAEVLLRFYSDGSDTTFDGEPIAIRYIGTTYRTIYFGVPLYYLADGDAQALADAALGDLGEPKGVSEDRHASARGRRFLLQQNSPNPFSRSTSLGAIVSRALPGGEVPTLSIYDSAGRLVRSLDMQEKGAFVYGATWHGDAEDGELLPSGTYFYTLSSSSHQTRKLILIR